VISSLLISIVEFPFGHHNSKVEANEVAILLKSFPDVFLSKLYLYIPIYAVLALIVLIPTRILGLMTANLTIASAWGTRKGAVSGAESSRLFSLFSLYPTLLAVTLLIAAVLIGVAFPWFHTFGAVVLERSPSIRFTSFNLGFDQRQRSPFQQIAPPNCTC
jgi:hypothetical protein